MPAADLAFYTDPAEKECVGGGHLRGFGRVVPDGAGFRITPVA